MNECDLHFHGPFSINKSNSLFVDPIANEKGIYLWAIKSCGKYFIEYVGETGASFKQRTKEELVL